MVRVSSLSGHIRRALSRRRVGAEDGFGMAELTVAIMILAAGFLALSGAMGFGFKQVAGARQRQTAAELASARVEHLRNLAYESVALSSQPAHSTDPENPDWSVSADGTLYDYEGESDCSASGPTCEKLIVSTASGAVLHLEDPVEVGPTKMEIYQYATWVDDAGIAGVQNYRRLTVVVKYKTPAIGGITRFVRASSLFTPGTVTVGGTGTTPNQGAGGSAPSPSPQPTGSCSGDTAAPTGSFSIESTTGSTTGYTNSTSVTLRMSFSDACTPITAKFSNDGVTYGADNTYDPNNPTVSWSITSGDGTKSVYAKVRDGVSNETTMGPQSVVLDTVKPTVPGTLSRTVSCTGEDRTVNLSWGTSSDTNLNGYRIYRSINTAAWEVIKSTTGTTHSETHKKTLDSARYYVVAYDKAGNESDPTNEISLAKNQCS